MRRTILVFGLLSGAVAAAMMLMTLPFHDKIGFSGGALVLGYTTIVLSLLFVYFGVRSYREQQPDGGLSFARGLTVGFAITLVSCACYVATWEVIYFKMLPDFPDRYAAHVIERAKASGASQAEIDKTTREMAEFKVMYNKPLYNMALTFLEPFPIGLLVALISAGVLRRRPAASSGSRAVPAGSAAVR